MYASQGSYTSVVRSSVRLTREKTYPQEWALQSKQIFEFWGVAIGVMFPLVRYRSKRGLRDFYSPLHGS